MLLSCPLPKDFDDLNTIVSVDELSKLMNEKRADSASRTRSASDESFTRGFVDNRYGILLTSQEAMAAVQQKQTMDYQAKNF